MQNSGQEKKKKMLLKLRPTYYFPTAYNDNEHMSYQV